MTQRVLVLGAHGLLGRALERHRPPAVETRRPSREDLPLDDLDRLSRVLREDPVDRLVLLAAWTRVDDCEADPERAFRVNGILPGRIAALAERRALPLVFLSTDYVFSGNFADRAPRPYREFDPAVPGNVYGESKWYGECAVREASPRARVVRTSALYGEGGPDFVSAIRARLTNADANLRVVADQVTAPSWVDHLAPALWSLILSEEAGTFHLAGGGATTWCDFAKRIVSLLGHDPNRVEPIAARDAGRAAARPAYSVLSSERARAVLGVTLPTWEEGIASFLGSAEAGR